MKITSALRLPFLLCVCAALRAQPTASLPVAPTDTVITSTSAEIWTNEAGTETYAIFKGNVVVTGTNLRITCDRIDATAVGKNDPASAKKAGTADDVEKFKTILATGKVHIIQGDREANCERAEVLPRDGKIVLTGNPVVIDRGAGAVFTGEPMTLLKNERRVMADSNVKITFPPMPDLGFDKNAPAPKPEAPKP